MPKPCPLEEIDSPRLCAARNLRTPRCHGRVNDALAFCSRGRQTVRRRTRGWHEARRQRHSVRRRSVLLVAADGRPTVPRSRNGSCLSRGSRLCKMLGARIDCSRWAMSGAPPRRPPPGRERRREPPGKHFTVFASLLRMLTGGRNDEDTVIGVGARTAGLGSRGRNAASCGRVPSSPRIYDAGVFCERSRASPREGRGPRREFESASRR